MLKDMANSKGKEYFHLRIADQSQLFSFSIPQAAQARDDEIRPI